MALGSFSLSLLMQVHEAAAVVVSVMCWHLKSFSCWRATMPSLSSGKASRLTSYGCHNAAYFVATFDHGLRLIA